MRSGRAMLLGTGLLLGIAGCSENTGARAGVEAILAMNHPLIVAAAVRGDFLTGDEAYVYVADDATDADARTVWCDVMVPSGLVEGRMRVTLATVSQERFWEMPDCDDPDDIPGREAY